MLTGLSGAAEVAILVDDHLRLGELARTLRARVGDGYAVLPWYDVSPELRAGLEIDELFSHISTAVVLFLVVLGVASAQLTSVLQRRRELAVLRAIGMSVGQLVKLMMVEVHSTSLSLETMHTSLMGVAVLKSLTSAVSVSPQQRLEL